jgi:cytochrome c oxidase cbb3-type subunit I
VEDARSYAGAPRAQGFAEDARLLSAYTIAATVWLLIATFVGLLISFKFSYPDLLSSPYFSFGRLRPIHTNGTFWGWASIALVGVTIWIAARSSGVNIVGRKRAWLALWCFNLVALAGTVTLDLGMTDGSQAYREYLWPIRALFVIAALIASSTVISTVAARRGHDIYISNWYFIGGFLFAATLDIIGILPWYQKGLGQTVVQGFFMHNAVGMWFTFLALGIIYYALPKLLNRPIYSYALGALGFWTNLVFYPVIGTHHYLFTPLPWWLQTLAIVFSVGMLVPVWAGSGNYWLTMRGHWATVRRSYALPFLAVGVALYFLGSTQGTIEALRSLQAIWHLTNFKIGHSHLTMYGFITFVAWGGIYAVLPAATGKEPSRLAVGIHFWCSLIGITGYVLAVSIAGTLQGLDWISGAPFIASVVAAKPFWLGRSVSGSMMFVGHVIFAYNVWRMTFAPAAVENAATVRVAA